MSVFAKFTHTLLKFFVTDSCDSSGDLHFGSKLYTTLHIYLSIHQNIHIFPQSKTLLIHFLVSVWFGGPYIINIFSGHRFDEEFYLLCTREKCWTRVCTPPDGNITSDCLFQYKLDSSIWAENLEILDEWPLCTCASVCVCVCSIASAAWLLLSLCIISCILKDLYCK